MKWFRDMKIGPKLMLAFMVVGAIAAFLGFMGINDMSTMNNLTDRLYSKDLPGVIYVGNANTALLQVIRAEQSLLLVNSAAERQKAKKRLDDGKTNVNTSLEQAKEVFHTETGKAILADFESAWKAHQATVERFENLESKGNAQSHKEALEVLVGEGRDKAQVAEDALAKLTARKQDTAHKGAAEAAALYESTRMWMLTLVISGVLLSIGLGFFISRSIASAVRQLVGVADKIAVGDVNQKLTYESGDELGQLANSFRRVIEYIGNVSEALEKVGQGDLSTPLQTQSQDRK